MGKKVAEKTANINLDGFNSRKNADKPVMIDGRVPPVTIPDLDNSQIGSEKTFTGAGIFMAAITGKDQVSKELLEAKAKLIEFDGSIPVRSINSKSIQRSQWANRMEDEFLTDEFRQLKNEIANAGGNVQPIMVRYIKDSNRVFDGKAPIYEIVFGHRRHQACLELGLYVNAIIDPDMDDKTLFESMDRENRSRKNLSPWEQGRMYEKALSNNLYQSLRQLSESIGINISAASRAHQLAKLPKELIDAFESPLDLHFRWAKPLADALQRDAECVMKCAKEICNNRGRLKPVEIFEHLTGNKKQTDIFEYPIVISGKTVASIKHGIKGRVIVEFERDVLPISAHKPLAILIETFLSNG